MDPADNEQVREAELVRLIHRAVGGPAKLSTYDDPAAVREVVLEALAAEYPTEAVRIRQGELTAFERRVVRTVTNRGAAVRSRMRQRRELARLRDELRRKDERIAKLEAALTQYGPSSEVWAATAVPVPVAVPIPTPPQHPPVPAHHIAASSAAAPPPPPTPARPSASSSTQSSADNTPLVSPRADDEENFGNIIDQMLSRI